MVFCNKCKHFEGGRHRRCFHPDNMVAKHDWEREWKSHIREPKYINKHNNCKWFERMRQYVHNNNSKQHNKTL